MTFTACQNAARFSHSPIKLVESSIQRKDVDKPERVDQLERDEFSILFFHLPRATKNTHARGPKKEATARGVAKAGRKRDVDPSAERLISLLKRGPDKKR